MSATDLLILFLVSLVANLLSALAGGGAGLLQLPALLFLGLPFGIALPTHKIASVALGVGAGFRHLRNRTIRPGLSAWILLTGLPGVWLGANLILSIPEVLAELGLGILTLGVGCYSALRPDLGKHQTRKSQNGLHWAIGGVGLFLIGVLNGSLTSGTGLFVTIWLVRWFGLDFTKAVSYTLILVGLFWNGAGAYFLGVQTTIAWEWLPPLLAGSVIGGYAGAHWALAKGNGLVKRAFECLTMLVGLHLIVRALMH